MTQFCFYICVGELGFWDVGMESRVCVCVCVRERERESARELGLWGKEQEERRGD